MDPARVRENLAVVRDRIARAQASAGLSQPVTIVAVTKTHPVAAVDAAVAAGLVVCGENRVTELEEKRAERPDLPIEWHLIGHLQRNKIRRALPLFELLHSLDSERLADELSAEAVRAGRTVRVLVQANVSGEETKGGFQGSGVLDQIARVHELPGLRVEGLMTMAPFTSDEAILRGTFSALRLLRDRCRAEVSGFTGSELSMGMSNDYEIAVSEGATMVRLGTALFGEREQ